MGSVVGGPTTFAVVLKIYSHTVFIGALGWIQTSGFTDLQSVALGLSATSALLVSSVGFELTLFLVPNEVP